MTNAFSMAIELQRRLTEPAATLTFPSAADFPSFATKEGKKVKEQVAKLPALVVRTKGYMTRDANGVMPARNAEGEIVAIEGRLGDYAERQRGREAKSKEQWERKQRGACNALRFARRIPPPAAGSGNEGREQNPESLNSTQDSQPPSRAAPPLLTRSTGIVCEPNVVRDTMRMVRREMTSVDECRERTGRDKGRTRQGDVRKRQHRI